VGRSEPTPERPLADRKAFLDRVREAVQAGNRPGSAAPIPERGNIGYQGAGADPLARFMDELRAAGGLPHPVADPSAATAQVLALVQEKGARKILLGRGRLLDRLDLAPSLRAAGIEVGISDALPAEKTRETFFAADIGITEADYLIAETGSIIQLARPDAPRSLSLLPPIHLVVADRSHLLPDLFDLFTTLGTNGTEAPTLPSCVTIITGPSKTGDIELKLVTGVHGPGEVHAILLDS
jgi:L-lactate dehydrogenase complex protein LldG